MKYNVETIVVTESCQRYATCSPAEAWDYVKNNNGTVFYRCKEMKIEEKIVFVGGKFTEFRLKVNRKVVEDPETLSNEVHDFLDYLDEAMHLWHS
jgi:hypothetical protein